MKENFDKAFDFVIGAEGELTEDPNDPGGLTKYGISQRAYPKKDIRNLTLDDAKAIYKADFWDYCHCDDIEYPVDIFVFDTAVNMGVKSAKTLYEDCESSVDFLMRRISRYTLLSQFNLYGKGWINRVLNLYRKFEVKP